MVEPFEVVVLDVDDEEIEITTSVGDAWRARGAIGCIALRGYDKNGDSFVRALDRDAMRMVRDAIDILLARLP
jgi:hypothetical protein